MGISRQREQLKNRGYGGSIEHQKRPRKCLICISSARHFPVKIPKYFWKISKIQKRLRIFSKNRNSSTTWAAEKPWLCAIDRASKIDIMMYYSHIFSSTLPCENLKILLKIFDFFEILKSKRLRTFSKNGNFSTTSPAGKLWLWGIDRA